MKRLPIVLRSAVAVAIAACCLDIAFFPRSSMANAWKDSLVEINDKDFEPWLRHYQIAVELGTPYYCKGLGSLPDSFDVMDEANKQFEKEFGFDYDDIPIPDLKKGTVHTIGMILIFESMKKTCPEIERTLWLDQD